MADQEDPEEREAAAPDDPSTLERWRTRTATGALITSVALGLQEVFDPQPITDDIVLEQPGPAEPPNRRIDLHFDPSDSRSTSVVILPPEE